MLALDMIVASLELKDTCLPLEPHITQVWELGKELEELAADLEGKERYSVTVHYGTVFATGPEAAISETNTMGDGFASEVIVDGESRPRRNLFDSDR